MRWWTEAEGGLRVCDNFEANVGGGVTVTATLPSFMSLGIDSRRGRALSSCTCVDFINWGIWIVGLKKGVI
jgi:hypothetical protein